MSEVLLHPSAGTGLLVALTGYAVVFFGLILLLCVVLTMGKIMVASRKKTEPTETPAPAAPAERQVAKGTAGELKLHDVSEKDAALIMAIVAHRLGKPINELRFRSIKEVKDK